MRLVTIRAMTDYLGQAFPRLLARLPRTSLADLPTPADSATLLLGGQQSIISIKHDEHSSPVYGGNKVRKLEYLLQRARDRNAKRVATFGTVASNHALATALHAATLDLECTCFLSHQKKTPQAQRALSAHVQSGTEIVYFGGDRRQRRDTLRKYLRGRSVWVIPIGGSNWLGTVAFINAALELADQIAAGTVPEPARLYVASGTMATAAGLALGLALAGRRTEVQAVRVTHEFIANRNAMQRLMTKTVAALHARDARFPADLATRTHLAFRDEFFGPGYAHSTVAADRAIELAGAQLGLTLDTSYTGKAMAALLHDAEQAERRDGSMLFWNTCNAEALRASADVAADTAALPREFLRYFE